MRCIPNTYGHVVSKCSGFARYGSLLRRFRRRMGDRRKFCAHGFIVHVPPRSEGSSWTGCSPPANRARYAMDVHPGTNPSSSEHVEDHRRELRPNGVLRSSRRSATSRETSRGSEFPCPPSREELTNGQEQTRKREYDEHDLVHVIFTGGQTAYQVP